MVTFLPKTTKNKTKEDQKWNHKLILPFSCLHTALFWIALHLLYLISQLHYLYDASKKGFYLYQFQGIWLDQFDKAFLPLAFIFNSWTRCVLGRSDDTSSALLILRDIFLTWRDFKRFFKLWFYFIVLKGVWKFINLVSSAKWSTFDGWWHKTSHLYTINSREPNMVPWGTSIRAKLEKH